MIRITSALNLSIKVFANSKFYYNIGLMCLISLKAMVQPENKTESCLIFW